MKKVTNLILMMRTPQGTDPRTTAPGLEKSQKLDFQIRRRNSTKILLQISKNQIKAK
jgi:hypothetical protein